MSNPLVAPVQDSTTAVSGVPLLEDATSLKSAIESGDWASVAMGAVGTALDALTAVMDPFGAVFAAGVGWLIEHVGPLKAALDGLTGNADEIAAQAQTWTNVAKELEGVSTELVDMVEKDLGGWSGPAAEAYRKRAADTSMLIASAQKGCEGASSGVKTAGEVVAAVRTLVRDIIAELVGHLISWALQVVFTLGIGMTWVVPQVIAAVAKTASKIASLTTKLVKALKALMPLLKKARTVFEDAAKALKNIKPGKVKPPAKPKDIKGGAAPESRPRGKDSDATTASSDHSGPSRTRGDDHPAPPGNRGEDGLGGGHPGAGPKDGPGGRAAPGDHTKASSARPKDPKAAGRDQICKPGSGDPVDPATGDMFDTQTDVHIEAALPLTLSRSHVSSYRAGRSFGSTWASTVDQRLEFDAEGVVFAAEDGTLLVYPDPPAGGGEVLPAAGPRWPLSRTADGYQVRQPLAGQSLRFGRAVAGRSPISAVLAGAEDRIDFDYDSARRLVAVRHSGGHHVEVTTDGDRVTGFSLRTGENTVPLVRFGYAGGRLAEVVNSSGRPMRFGYDADGRVSRWEDRNGEWYSYHYDATGRVVRTEGSGGALTGEWQYDGRVTTYTDAAGYTTLLEFNEAHQLVRETDPLGHVTLSEWDEFNRLLSRTDPLGRTFRYAYTENGELAAVTRPDGTREFAEFDEQGRRATAVEADGAVWRYTYDDRGYPASIEDPAGSRVGYTYDGRGRLTAVTDPLGGVLRLESDAAGRLLAVTDRLGGTTRYTRDQFGRVATVTDPLGAVTALRWTVEGNPLSVALPDGSIEQWRYDGEGNQVAHLDPRGGQTRVETTHFDLPAAETRPDGSKLEFDYDSALRLTAVRDPNGLSWQYRYDAAGRLVSETDFDGRELRYSYDAAGQLVERVNGAGESIRFVRDLLGNVIEKHSGGQVETFEYDPAERLVRAVNADADVLIERDAVGRELREIVNGRVLESRYDAAGRRVYRRTPTGAESFWDHDADHQAVELRTGGRALSFGLDLAGREVERLLDTGVVLVQRWDARNRLAEQHVSAVSGGGARVRRIQQRGYHYRADGHVTAVDDRLAGNRVFELDDAGRVIGVRGASWAERYAYDGAGNVVDAACPGREPDTQGSRVYQGTRLRTAGGLAYRYDAQGRVVTRQRKRLSSKPDTWHFSWDAEDRMTGAVTPEGTRWRYCYDALGRRVAKQRLAPDGVTAVEQIEFTWDDTTLVEQVHNSQRATTWNHQEDTDVPITQVARIRTPDQAWVDTEFYSIITDLIGSPAELVDEHGNLAWQARSTLWGEPLPSVPGQANIPLRFPGQYFDAETGLHYNVHRYYDPVTARFVSNDPLGLDPSPNPAAYVHNPVTWRDPLGLTGSPGGCGGGSRNIVYRNIRDEEDPSQGLFPKDSNKGKDKNGLPIRRRDGSINYDKLGTPSGHVQHGGKKKNRKEFKDRFISTTKDYRVAKKHREPGQRTVAIDLNKYRKQPGGSGAGAVIDVSTAAGRAEATRLFGGGWGKMTKNWGTSSQEVLLGGGVAPGSITQVHPRP
ncbi:RHS repeat-associated core domain-containing protein [Amycolatopsis sp. NPDC004378]